MPPETPKHKLPRQSRFKRGHNKHKAELDFQASRQRRVVRPCCHLPTPIEPNDKHSERLIKSLQTRLHQQSEALTCGRVKTSRTEAKVGEAGRGGG